MNSPSKKYIYELIKDPRPKDADVQAHLHRVNRFTRVEGSHNYLVGWGLVR